MPQVSVIMPVYNREALIRESIDSILSQTFTDFELIVVDDGSTDGTAAVIDAYDDNRIVRTTLPMNCGISAARNAALSLAQGEFVALMDSDNIALPGRLAAQAAFLEGHADLDIIGTGVVRFSDDEQNELRFAREDAVIKARLLVLDGSAIRNGSVMMRRSFLHRSGITYRNLPVDEDHAMWIDAMAAGARFANLEDVHLHSRRHSGNITFEKSPRWQAMQAAKTPLRAELLGLWFPDLTYAEARTLARLMEANAGLSIDEAGLGIATAAKVGRYREARFGASTAHIGGILDEACNNVRRAVKNLLKPA